MIKFRLNRLTVKKLFQGWSQSFPVISIQSPFPVINIQSSFPVLFIQANITDSKAF